MNIYTGKNVFEEARERVSFIFDEFDTVIVNMSGGKDSTVVFNLCLEEAERRGRLPLPVLFIDQEAEWQGTVDYVKSIMYDKRVKPYWLQVPIRLFNATSHESDNWLHCWGPGEKWMREKDPIAIKENVYGTDRFKPLFDAFLDTFDERTCNVTGMRCEESPNRRTTLTSYAKYKHVTWCKRSEAGRVTFSPIYDWKFSDVWHAICVNGWKYNKVYDQMYRLGVTPSTFGMRISNLNHETAVKDLYFVREIEPNTWDKLTARMNGVDTTSNISYSDNFGGPKELPFMFQSWKQYRDYLAENLVRDQNQRQQFKEKFAQMDALLCGDKKIFDEYTKVCVASILANDYTFTKISNFMSQYETKAYITLRNGRAVPQTAINSKGHGRNIRAIVERIENERRDHRDTR